MRESKYKRVRRLGRLSRSVLREDSRLVVFPAVAAAVSLAIGALSFLLAYGVVGVGHNARLIIVLAGIVASYPATFAANFCGVALAHALATKLDGGEVKIDESWRAARERLGIILAWTLLVCTVGAVLRLLEERIPLFGRLAVYLVDLSWSLATLFAVPVLAYEGLGPIATLKRSAGLFKARWGEQIAGNAAILVVDWVLSVPFVLVLFAGIMTGGAGGIALIALGGGGLLAVTAYCTALAQVYRVFLYRFATGAPAASIGPFSESDLQHPFREGR